MTMKLKNVQFIDGGYCQQFARLAGAKSWKWIRFHAVFVYFEHPDHGPSLVDTGYSDYFFSATRTFPERFYRWVTPITLNSPQNTAERLRSVGINPDSIQRIFITHFHADHIGGLRCFPHAKLIYRADSYQRLLSQTRSQQVQHGFLADLVPQDLMQRSNPLLDGQFHPGTGDLNDFQTIDYWEDGSLLIVDLPGHADGHFGVVLQTESERLFYIVDATWHLDVLLADAPLPFLSRRFQDQWPAYQLTLNRLRHLALHHGWNLVACHCPRTVPKLKNVERMNVAD